MQLCRLFAVLAFVTCWLYGQGSDLGTIRGAVTDASGARVPNAKITITDLSTDRSRSVTTNAQGDYEAVGLKSGNYKVVVSAEGFSTVEITGVVLTGSDTASANA